VLSEKKILNETKNHNPPTLQVKWSVPNDSKVTSEHLKYGGQKLIIVLTMLINFIFQNKHIPPILKSGIACPIYKKGGKPADNPNSYRKITVTNPIGKLIEKLHLCRNTKYL
jgi:hypothetical protein